MGEVAFAFLGTVKVDLIFVIIAFGCLTIVRWCFFWAGASIYSPVLPLSSVCTL
jgi:hypothetical protein